jgi:hypothetical protein
LGGGVVGEAEEDEMGAKTTNEFWACLPMKVGQMAVMTVQQVVVDMVMVEVGVERRVSESGC